ncbi:MAG: (Fe-S)-binding protein [Gammaproteobacteria bacterium]|nr:(Fe-S)-binding protein [Gammaproteobacteria bacterium]
MSERLEKGLEVLRSEVDYKVESFFSSCVNCGICAESCLFYTETRDPRYTPIYKTEPLRKLWQKEYTLWGRLAGTLGIGQPMTEADLADWEELVYDGCSMCGRCSMVCPVGVDISGMIFKVKHALAKAGFSPEGLVGAARRALEIGSPMGITLTTVKAVIKHVEEDTGLKMPVDVEGADYLALLSSNEIALYPEYLDSLARIFDHAGVSWTLSTDAFEATNAGLQIGNKAIAGQLVQRVVDGAEKLKVKSVISPECGHAYTALRWEGPNFIGKAYSFRVVHILELLDELRAQGRLRTTGKESERISFHDPCSIVRRGGIQAQPRNLLQPMTENFVEMKDHGSMNWCCGGGGGVSSNERAEELKLTAFNRKKSQIDEINVEKVVTACSNCRMVMEDGIEANEMDIELVGLTEMIARHLADERPT